MMLQSSFHSAYRLSIMLLCLIALMMANSSIYLPCMPAMVQDLHTIQAALSFSLVITPLTAAISSLFFGILCDRYGRRIITLGSLISFLLGSIICSVSFSIIPFLLARCLQAIGDAGLNIVVLVIISDFFQGEAYARLLGISSALVAFSAIVSPLLGAQIFSLLGWRYNFVLIALITLCFLIVLWQRLPESGQQKRVDIHKKWRQERKDISTFFLNRQFVIIMLAQAIPLGIFAAFEFNSSFLYIHAYHFTAIGYSLIQALLLGTNFLSSLMYSYALTYFNFRTILILAYGGFILFTVGCGMMLVHLLPDTPYMTLAVIGMLAFILPFILSTGAAQAVSLDERKPGVILALIALSRGVGSTIISTLVSFMFNNTIESICLFTLPFSTLAIFCLQKLQKR